MNNTLNKYLPFCMWFFPVFFFAYQFILRLWPGLMMQPIMEQFSIDAKGFGLLAACYYYGYAGMQIPIALLLQKFGTRLVISFFALLCGLAMLLFSTTDNYYLALFSRFLIGVGSAVGFLGTSQVIAEWFKKEDYGSMVGLSFSVGLLGAVYGGKPLSLLLSHHNGQAVGIVLALISILIAVAVLLLVRTKSEPQAQPSRFELRDLHTIISSRYIWLLAIANLLMVGSLEGFADVWGIPYLMTAYTYSKTDAALLTSFIFIGMLFGGPMLALFAKRFGTYTVLIVCGISLGLAFFLLLSHYLTSWLALSSLFFIIGILCCYQVLVFAAGAKLVAAELLGISVAFLNCINMLGGSFFHTLIGTAIDYFWDGRLNQQGIKLYSLAAYNNALLVVPLSACIGAIFIYYLERQATRRAVLC